MDRKRRASIATLCTLGLLGHNRAKGAEVSGSNQSRAARIEVVADYDALRAYSGTATLLSLSGYTAEAAPSAIAGTFVRDDSDPTSADNGGTIIVANNKKRWKRQYCGTCVSIDWFGARGDWNGVSGTDDSLALQAALNACEVAKTGILFGPGKRYYLNTKVWAASTLQDFTYRLQGAAGMNTELVLGPNIGADFLLNVGKTIRGAVPNPGGSHYRLIVEHLRIRCEKAHFAGQGFARFWGTHSVGFSGHFSHVEFQGLMYGAMASGYCDMIAFEKVHSRSMQPGGLTYKNTGNGDAFSAKSCFFGTSQTDYGGIHLQNALGGSFENCVGGTHIIQNCQSITVTASHNENTDKVSVGLFTVIGSNVTFRDTIFGQVAHYDSVSLGHIIIDDSAGYRSASNVTFDNVRFFYLSRNGNQPRIPDIYIKSPSSDTRIIFKNTRSVFMIDQRQIYEYQGIIIASNSAEISSLVSSPSRALLACDVELCHTGGTEQWQLSTNRMIHGMQIIADNQQRIYISGLKSSVEGFSTLTSGKYYYNYQAIDWNGNPQPASGEKQITITAGKAIVSNVTASNHPRIIRVWRGGAPTSYDRYCDVVMTERSIELWDQGELLQGNAWITSRIPAVAAPADISDGLRIGTHQIIYRSSPPTSAAYKAGDICFNTAFTASGKVGWVCIAGGTPGTWRAFGPIDP